MSGWLQGLASQKWPSLSVLADSSPKGKLDVSRSHLTLLKLYVEKARCLHKVWLPMVCVGTQVACWCPQRLPDLVPSTAPVELKMEEAAAAADSFASRFLDDDTGKAAIRNLLLASKFNPQYGCVCIAQLLDEAKSEDVESNQAEEAGRTRPSSMFGASSHSAVLGRFRGSKSSEAVGPCLRGETIPRGHALSLEPLRGERILGLLGRGM